jgi:hypothetical protein
MNLCKKLHDLPSVATDWQQTTWCPDCEYYECGKCHDPIRTENNAPCPFDGKELPLREVTADPNNDQPQKPLDAALNTELESQSESSGLEQAIKHRILQRTGRKIQTLEVEAIGNRVVIRGCAPCYYLKQLALQGVLDVIGSGRPISIELNVRVPGSTATLGADAQ